MQTPEVPPLFWIVAVQVAFGFGVIGLCLWAIVETARAINRRAVKGEIVTEMPFRAKVRVLLEWALASLPAMLVLGVYYLIVFQVVMFVWMSMMNTMVPGWTPLSK